LQGCANWRCSKVHDLQPDDSAEARIMNTRSISATMSPPLTRACPRCQGIAYRIRRRGFDRFISEFFPVCRYQCHSVRCGWRGNLRAPR
jgi:hypothetical protein